MINFNNSYKLYEVIYWKNALIDVLTLSTFDTSLLGELLRIFFVNILQYINLFYVTNYG